MEDVMDFTKYKCPVCDKQFEKDEDIVVCPECGTPHHRGCYEIENHCFYEDKHSEDFSFEELENENSAANSDATVICPRCKTENPKDFFYCKHCGMQLFGENNNSANQNTNNEIPNYQQFNQFDLNGMPGFNASFIFDPMAGLDSNMLFEDDVNAGEMAKYVGKNTQYFLRVFNRIKTLKTSKFNFAAFLFHGAYFLYRKMYILGVILSVLILGLMVGEAYIKTLPDYQNLFHEIMNAQTSAGVFSTAYLSDFTQQELYFFMLPSFLNFVRFIIMIICGIIANRFYFNHCKKSIRKIKSTDNSVNINSILEAKGGVNTALAVCVLLIAFTIPLFVNM